METNKRLEQYINIHNTARKIFEKKNHDYGDAFAEYGVVGVLVRMGDKIKRLQTITNQKIILVDNESIRDTLLDLHNYSAMALMLLQEDEEKEKDKDKDKEREILNMKEEKIIDTKHDTSYSINEKETNNKENNITLIISEAGVGNIHTK